MDRNLTEKIRASKKPVLILLYGMPGSKKSSTAIKLAAALDFKIVIGTDEIREIQRQYDNDPFLQGASHNRWQLLGKETEENLIEGFNRHCRAIRCGVKIILEKSQKNGENLIIEGVHLIPELYKNLSEFKVFHFFLTVKDSQLHQQNIQDKFLRRHGQWEVWNEDTIKRMSKIQTHLITQAKKNSRIVIVPSKTPKDNCQMILKYLTKALR